MINSKNNKKIFVLFWIAISCIILLISCKKRRTDDCSDLTMWIGEYTYSESLNESEYSLMFMNYYIEIYQSDNNYYYADIEIDGQTTLARIQAIVYGGKNWASLVFSEYLPSHISGGITDEENGVLISFKKEGNDIFTYWGAISPMLYENQESGKIYFSKIE